MTKRKREPTSFHSRFQEPTDNDRVEALGEFPLNAKQPEALWEHTPCSSPDDLNDPILYHPTMQKIPPPAYELDWLAQVPEEGQSIADYICFLTSRSGRLRPIANASGTTICLLPIVSPSTSKECWWPDYAPKLEYLATLTKNYFQRPVKILKPATLTISSSVRKNSSGNLSGEKSSKTASLFFCNEQGQVCKNTRITVRHDSRTRRSQYEVTSILNQLSKFRYDTYGEENFCVMGVTMEDLYDGPNDLFCAGMAFGGDKVAVFSFCRYHPNLRMSPLRWWDYGYSTKPGTYSYFDADTGPKISLLPSPPKPSKAGEIEYLRRSSKLLVHELGHLYGLDHCIHYKCLMMGTGHLVEDFQAPMHLCGVCLRKLQWRLGFSVEGRYHDIATSLKEMGLAKEVRWIKMQLASITKKRKAEGR